MPIPSLSCISQVLLTEETLMRWIARCLITFFLTYKPHLIILKRALHMFFSTQNSLLLTHYFYHNKNKNCREKNAIGLSQENLAEPHYWWKNGTYQEKAWFLTFTAKLTRACHKSLTMVMNKVIINEKFKRTN
jgi:hypothetical protein